MLGLLWIPGILLILAGALWLTTSLERHVLSPRAFVVHVARSRRASPERAEALVAALLAPLVARIR